MTLRKKDPYLPPDDALWLVPLGGCGEIGMNLYLYGTKGKWLMVECGVTFGDESTPGIELIMPDISFIAERKDDLVGLVVTHGHEDHIGAIEHLWQHLQCPVYAPPFTASMIRAKLAQAGLKDQVRLIELAKAGSFEIGPFKAEMVPVTHSIPEAHMISIQTPHGRVVHTGDWKFDPDPIVGDPTAEERLKELGREGVMAVAGDSTNAMVPRHSLSERDVQKSFLTLFRGYSNRIIITCFASNIARLKSIAVAAHDVGRYVALVGRSLWRNAEIAEAHGYLPEFASFLSEHEAMQAPREKMVFVCTGCQGEVRAALTRIALGDHPEVTFDPGDVVMFSSREIPGNEKAIARVQNLLISRGLQILTSDTALVHVSGHAGKPEMQELYSWLRPHLVVPVHGELRHQMAHAELAREAGVSETMIINNGQIARLGPGVHEIVGEVPVGRLGMDGKILRALDREVVKGRRKMSFNGAAVVAVALDRYGNIAHTPQVTLLGLEDDGYIDDLRLDLAESIETALTALPLSSRKDDAAVRQTMQQTARKHLNATQGKKPVIEVQVMRV
jgi:ribonuclease J